MNFNSDPHFWDMKHDDCNCGSYAFNLSDWYYPYDDEDEREEFISNSLCDGETIDDINECLLEKDVKQMFKDFGNRLTKITEREAIENNEDCIIAYRVGIVKDDDSDYDDFDYDFHFRVKINGVWREKNGSCSVHECDLDPYDDWENVAEEIEWNNDTKKWEKIFVNDDTIIYNSRIVYFKYMR